MVIVELQQPNYDATIEAIAQAVPVEMSTKLTTHIEDFERLANDVLLAVWDRLEGATSGEDAQRRPPNSRKIQ